MKKCFMGVALGWACQDPNSAAELAMKLLDGDDKITALKGIASVWVLKDPRAVAEWAAKRIDGEEESPGLESRVELFVGVMQKWFELNAEAAKEWFDGAKIYEDVKEQLLVHVRKVLDK